MNLRARNGMNGLFFWVLFCGAWWVLAGVVFCLWGCYNDVGKEAVAPGRVTFLDVGQGLAVLLEQDGLYAMYDMGPDSAGVLDTLRERGVDTLEWAVISHNHRDHGGSVFEMNRRGARVGSAGSPKDGSAAPYIRRLYVGPDTAGGFVRDSVLRVMKRLDIPVDTLYRGDELSLGSLKLRVLWPASFMRVGDNGASLVLRGSADETSFLLTGDLDSAGEHGLLKLSTDVTSELLQVGHHGSSGSSSLGFLSRVAPRLAVISVGAHNGYGHPTKNVLRKLQYVLNAPTDSTLDSPISRTDQEGSVSYWIIPGVGILKE